jgi:hypothetical protein
MKLVRKAASSLAVNTRLALKYCYKCLVIVLTVPGRPHNEKLSIADSVRTVDHLTLEQRFAALAKDKFLSVPVEAFEAAGREQLDYLRKAGLSPGSKLVDLGCGVLRAGYWIIRFLDSGCYCGIEPHQERLQIGIHSILDPGTIELKRPRFHTNPNFDTSVFGVKFDFFLAYSVWTHASKSQIQTMLDADPPELAVSLRRIGVVARFFGGQKLGCSSAVHLKPCASKWHPAHSVIRFCSASSPPWLRSSLW